MYADGIYSDKYSITALPLPQVVAFGVKLEYPQYLKRQAEEIKNTGDLNIPAGTKVTWGINTVDSKDLLFYFDDKKKLPAEKTSETGFLFSKVFFNSTGYKMQAVNGFIDSVSAVGYAITVVPDLYPSVKVDQQNDSIFPEKAYFKGGIKDDYGFSRLVFKYRLKCVNDTGKSHSIFLPINLNLLEQDFFLFLRFFKHFWRQ